MEFSETLTPAPAKALAGLLGTAEPDENEGLPPLWHWVYLLDHPAQADLGRDGHRAATGVPHPPEPGRRRMWAGGRVRTHTRLRFGEPAVRRSYIRDSVDKQGRSGRLTFVTVAHEISQNGQIVVGEEQDILYRDAATSPPEQRAPVIGEADLRPHERRVEVGPVLLFRFSALTYNGHRIHYDRDYARQVEGYPGLVVHGPLQALLMAEAARALRPSVDAPTAFDYRLVSPLFDHQGLVVGASPDDAGTADASLVKTAARDASGRTTAVGTFQLLKHE